MSRTRQEQHVRPVSGTGPAARRIDVSPVPTLNETSADPPQVHWWYIRKWRVGRRKGGPLPRPPPPMFDNGRGIGSWDAYLRPWRELDRVDPADEEVVWQLAADTLAGTSLRPRTRATYATHLRALARMESRFNDQTPVG